MYVYTADSRLSVCGLSGLWIIRAGYFYTFVVLEIMILMHILNLVAVLHNKVY